MTIHGHDNQDNINSINQDMGMADSPRFGAPVLISGEITSGTHNSTGVANIGILFCNSSSGNITINGLANGVVGQVLYIRKSVTANTVSITNLSIGGTQKFLTNTGGTVTITSGGHGGLTAICVGALWIIDGL